MPVSSATAAPASSPIGAAMGSSDVNKNQFLQLLVHQLKAQDPFEPVKNEQFLAQLATFSQLEEQQSSSGLLRNILAAQEAQLTLGGLSQAASLIGREVEYIDGATGEQSHGTVQKVFFAQEGVMVEIDGQIVPAGNIITIAAGSAGGTGTGNGNATTPTTTTPGTTPTNSTTPPQASGNPQGSMSASDAGVN